MSVRVLFEWRAIAPHSRGAESGDGSTVLLRVAVVLLESVGAVVAPHMAQTTSTSAHTIKVRQAMALACAVLV